MKNFKSKLKTVLKILILSTFSSIQALSIIESKAEMIANGLGNPRATFVRFNEAY